MPQSDWPCIVAARRHNKRLLYACLLSAPIRCPERRTLRIFMESTRSLAQTHRDQPLGYTRRQNG